MFGPYDGNPGRGRGRMLSSSSSSLSVTAPLNTSRAPRSKQSVLTDPSPSSGRSSLWGEGGSMSDNYMEGGQNSSMNNNYPGQGNATTPNSSLPSALVMASIASDGNNTLITQESSNK